MSTTTTKPVVRRGMRTPWGEADAVAVVTEGIGWVSTPSHGGLKLSAAMNRRVPDYMRQNGGWYEEDCEWSKAFVALAKVLRAIGSDKADSDCASAVTTLRSYYPDSYERFFGETIPPGESRAKDERIFNAEHANDLIVISALNYRNDMVKVTATVGGKRSVGRERFFLVPKADYDARSKFGFVVDPEKYEGVA